MQRTKVHRYLAGICNNIGCPPMEINGLSRFHWKKGYGAFAADFEAMPAIDRYIENQQSHHLKLSFQDEFRELYREAGVEIDERFAWD